MDLPEEIWISIFNLLGHYRHFKFISSVSRRLLSITNGLRCSLTITNEVIPFLPSLLRRFPNIDQIKIRISYDILDSVLYHISVSNIVLTSISFPDQKRFPVAGLRHLGSKMGSSLRILDCSNTSHLKDDHLVTIMNMFPFLEDLDIQYDVCRYYANWLDRCSEFHSCPNCESAGTVSDNGIHQLSLGLRELRKIDLSGNDLLTDRSIISLSSNCSLLRELRTRNCKFTMNGIGKALRDCHHLNYISTEVPSIDEYFSKSFAYARNLHELDLFFRRGSFSSSPHEFLSDLAKANLPLERLVLKKARGLTDQSVSKLSKFIKNITYINMSGCYKLTSSAFFTIIENCPFLSDIVMNDADLRMGKAETDSVVNDQVKNIDLSGNRNLCNEFMKRIAFTCPNIEKLDISSCHGITVVGLNVILRNCREIKHLDIGRCWSVTKFDVNIQLPNLQVLQARGLDLDDKSLEIIGKRCNGLLYLDLEKWNNVSGNGIIKVLKLCRRLRRINLLSCKCLDSDTILSLLSSKSSLRKITPLCEIVRSESEKKLFWQSICQFDLLQFDYEIYCA